MPRRLDLPTRLSVLVLTAAASSSPAWASTSASSASSEGISASVGSVSTSIEASSNSSSPGGKTAEGPYRVIDVAVDGAGVVRVALAAEAGEHRFTLLLPAGNPEAARLAAGDVVVATSREYGTQFARAGATEPFYLVVEDRRLPELRTKPVAG